MPTKKPYSQAARVQGILRTLGARHGITIGESEMSLYETIEEWASSGRTGRTAGCTAKEIVDHFNGSEVMIGGGSWGETLSSELGMIM